MKLKSLAVIFACSLSSTGHACMAQSEFMQARPGEALLGPFPINQTIEGVSVSLRTYAFLSLTREGDSLLAGARVLADLSDLQTKIGSIIDKVSLPTDNCSHFGVDNLVARIWGKQITIDGEVATLRLNGDVEDWTCAKNPIPCSRLDGWELVFYDCNPPIKNRNIQQPFGAALPFRLQLADPHTVEVKLGDPSVNLGGPLGGVTGGILRIAGVDINTRAKEALQSMISPEVLRASLPPALLRLNPSFTKAELRDESGALAAVLEMSFSIDREALHDLGKIFEDGVVQ